MPKRRSRTRSASTEPPDHERRWFRHAGVWLATLSTVVGVATGMFTLRDQVFPRESGTAVAVSVPAYQQDVGRVCDELNDDDRDRARQDTTIRRRLRRAKTTMTQRNALLDGVRRTAARSGNTLASFTALEAPPTLAARHRTTRTTWERNLERLRAYALALDRAANRRQVLAALDRLSTQRPVIARDGVAVRAGLQRLGAENCDLDPPIVTATYTLPPLPGHEGGTTSGTTPSPSGGDGGVAPPPATTPSQPATGGAGTTTTTTDTVAGGTSGGGGTTGANTPPPTAGGGGGD